MADIHSDALKAFIQEAVHEAFAQESEQVGFNVQELHNAAAAVAAINQRLQTIRHPLEFSAASDQFREALLRLEAALEHLPHPEPCVHEPSTPDAPYPSGFGPSPQQHQHGMTFESMEDIARFLQSQGLFIVRLGGPPGFMQ